MATEIERKFLLRDQSWKTAAEGVLYRQGYVSTSKDTTVRVRVAGSLGFLTIKGSTTGISRLEFDYEIPLADASEMLDMLCMKPLIEKTRFRVEHQGHCWEIDEFHGDNEGLVLAEIELQQEDEGFVRPNWLGEEVSGDPRYYNSSLAHYPYNSW